MFKPTTLIETALLPAGSHSAASPSRAEKPAPLRPHGGAGTLSLFEAAIGRRQQHPLVAEVRNGAPRAFFVHARRMPPTPRRRSCIESFVERAVIECLRFAGAALIVAAVCGLIVGLTGSQPSDVVTLQAEVRR